MRENEHVKATVRVANALVMLGALRINDSGGIVLVRQQQRANGQRAAPHRHWHLHAYQTQADISPIKQRAPLFAARSRETLLPLSSLLNCDVFRNGNVCASESIRR